MEELVSLLFDISTLIPDQTYRELMDAVTKLQKTVESESEDEDEEECYLCYQPCTRYIWHDMYHGKPYNLTRAVCPACEPLTRPNGARLMGEREYYSKMVVSELERHGRYESERVNCYTCGRLRHCSTHTPMYPGKRYNTMQHLCKECSIILRSAHGSLDPVDLAFLSRCPRPELGMKPYYSNFVMRELLDRHTYRCLSSRGIPPDPSQQIYLYQITIVSGTPQRLMNTMIVATAIPWLQLEAMSLVRRDGEPLPADTKAIAHYSFDHNGVTYKAQRLLELV
jgi:hypothetical protein